MEPRLFDLHAALEDRHWWFVGRRRVVRALVEAVLPPDGQGTVVDIGAGTGGTAASFADTYEVLAVEPSPHAAAVARARHPRVRFIELGTIGAQMGGDPARRVYLLMDVAEHVADDFRLISEIVCAMAPGSHLVVTVPADPALWSSHDVQFGHYRRYTPERLARTWQGLPVEVCLFADFNRRLAPAIRLFRLLARTILGTRSRHSDLSVPVGPVNGLLTAVFAGEQAGLVRALGHRPTTAPRGRGVSLLAVLRRAPGTCSPRTRPTGEVPDEVLRR